MNQPADQGFPRPADATPMATPMLPAGPGHAPAHDASAALEANAGAPASGGDAVVTEPMRRRRDAATRAIAAKTKRVDAKTKDLDASTAAATVDGRPTVGGTFARFQLTDRLGEGYSSVVFKAHHRMLGIDVALKVLLNRDMDESALQLVYREANLLAKLNHPNIIRILDFDRHQDYHFLILEYVDGPTLRSLIEESGTIDAVLLLDIVTQAVEALAYAHGFGVVHNDIKPANLLLTREGEVKVADLGMARVATSQDGKAAAGGANSIAGTPAYISPEMVTKGLVAADHRSDIYSLGVTMYQALSGRLPFVESDPMRLMLQHVSAEPPPLSETRPGVDLALATLIACMMAKEPGDRPQSWDELLADLRVIHEGLASSGSATDTSFSVIFDDKAGGSAAAGMQVRRHGWLRRLMRF